MTPKPANIAAYAHNEEVLGALNPSVHNTTIIEGVMIARKNTSVESALFIQIFFNASRACKRYIDGVFIVVGLICLLFIGFSAYSAGF